MPEQPAPKSPAPQPPKAPAPGEKSQFAMPLLDPSRSAQGNARGTEEPREGAARSGALEAAAPGRGGSGVMPAVQLASGTALLHAARLVDVGRTRDHQEDAAGIFVPGDPEQVARKGYLYVVADGMGGHNAGEIASQTALTEIQRVYYSSPEQDTPAALRQAITSANQTIQRFALADSQQMGMGTTAAVAVVRGQDVHVANVGDSRVYLVRNGKATQITQDHSWVEEQVRAGVLAPEQARIHPQRNIITRALGTGTVVEPDLFAGVLQEGDVLVLTSDGLTGHVGDAELGEIASTYPPEQAVRRLVDLANERGGSDNISVIVVRAEAPPPAPAIVAAASADAVPQVAKETGRRSLNGVVVIGLLVAVLLVVAVIAFFMLRKSPETPRTKDALIPSVGAPAAAITSTVDIAAETLAPALHAGASVTVTEALTGEVAVMGATSVAVGTPGAPASATATLKPTPSPTPIPSPTPTRRPGLTITPQSATPAGSTPGGTPSSGGTGSIQAPQLTGPADDVIVTGDQTVTFTWDWSGRLSANQGFEVRIWRTSATDHPGAAPPVQETSQSIQVSGTEGVANQDGNYLWTVAVVQLSPYRRVGLEGTPRRLTYRSSAGGEPGRQLPLDRRDGATQPLSTFWAGGNATSFDLSQQRWRR